MSLTPDIVMHKLNALQIMAFGNRKWILLPNLCASLGAFSAFNYLFLYSFFYFIFFFFAIAIQQLQLHQEHLPDVVTFRGFFQIDPYIVYQ